MLGAGHAKARFPNSLCLADGSCSTPKPSLTLSKLMDAQAREAEQMRVEACDKLLLSAAETAQLLGISRSAFYSLLSSGRIGPLPVRLGRRTLWRRDLLELFVAWNCPPREKFLQLLEQQKGDGR